MKVTASGSLNAKGTESKPIVFGSRSTSPGSWEAVVFDSASSDNVLDHVEISYGGAGLDAAFSGAVEAAVIITALGRLTLRNTRFVSNATHGLVIEAGGELVDFAANEFSNHGGSPIVLHPEHIASLDSASVFAGTPANTLQYVQVEARDWSTPGTWPALDVPYRISGRSSFVAGSAVDNWKVAAGAQLVFDAGAGLRIQGGAIVVEGTETAPVIFRGDVASPGYWEGFVVANDNPNNRFNHAHFRDGGAGESAEFSGGLESNVVLTIDGRAGFSHCEFRNALGAGLRLNQGARLSEFRSNVFGGNGGPPLSIPAGQLAAIDGESVFDDPADPHTTAALRVRADTVRSSGIWPATDVPLHFEGLTTIELGSGAIIVSAGAILQLGAGAGLRATSGGLTFEGTESAPISVTGTASSPGVWEAVVFASDSADNALDHTTVEYGGAGSSAEFSGAIEANVVVQSGASLRLTNSTVRHGKSYGLWSEGTIDPADPTSSGGNTFSNNPTDMGP